MWFLDRAASAGSHLSARRLQCLLFMAQARYARANDGRKLMPATFLAAEAGPIEPTIYHIMGHGRPLVTAPPPSAAVEEFLMDLWERLARLPDEELSRRAHDHPYYVHAFAHGRNSEVVFADAAPRSEDPALKTTRKTRSGATIKKWVPGSYGSAPPREDKRSHSERASGEAATHLLRQRDGS